MSKSTSQDSLVAYKASAIIIVIAISLGASWYFLKASERKQVEVSYSTFGPTNIQTHGYGIRASIAIQTRAGNSDWMIQNRSKLDNVIQKVLAETDPSTIRSPEGIQHLQIVLKDAGNAALNTNNVEAVLLTDLLLVQNDE